MIMSVVVVQKKGTRVAQIMEATIDSWKWIAASVCLHVTVHSHSFEPKRDGLRVRDVKLKTERGGGEHHINRL